MRSGRRRRSRCARAGPTTGDRPLGQVPPRRRPPRATRDRRTASAPPGASRSRRTRRGRRRRAPAAPGSCANARRVASRRAAVIPMRSHSSGLACPTAQAVHQAATVSKICSRTCSDSCFESRSPRGRRCGAARSTATPTVSGPAQAPRPTSSIPATSWCPAAPQLPLVHPAGARRHRPRARSRPSRNLHGASVTIDLVSPVDIELSGDPLSACPGARIMGTTESPTGFPGSCGGRARAGASDREPPEGGRKDGRMAKTVIDPAEVRRGRLPQGTPRGCAEPLRRIVESRLRDRRAP